MNIETFVSDLVLTEWKSLPLLTSTSSDYNAAIKIFAKLAVESAKPLNAATGYTSAEMEKVKAFVQKNSALLRRECESGYPFALIDKTASESALKHVLNANSSILAAHLLQSENWLEEEALSSTFCKNITPLTFRGIPYTCCLLMEAYKKGDLKAGYYLLWLIKQYGGATFTLPKKEAFSTTPLQKAVSDYIEKNGFWTRPHHFIDILFAGTQNPMFIEILGKEQQKAFFNLVQINLSFIKLDSWPNKHRIIYLLLSASPPEDQLRIARALTISGNTSTVDIGKHVEAILKAEDEAYPHFVALRDLLQVSVKKVCKLFNRHLIEIFSDKVPNAPDFTKGLTLNVKERVLFHGDLMIGLYQPAQEGEKVNPFLIAFNRKTEKMAWTIPLPLPANLDYKEMQPAGKLPKIQIAGNFIEVHTAGDDKIYQFQVDTGVAIRSIQIPANEDLYQLTEGLKALKTGSQLQLGKISEEKWCPFFNVTDPGGVFKPHPTLLIFHNQSLLYLISPSGKQTKLRGCLDVMTYGPKLCLIEQSSNQCFLTIRSHLDQEIMLSGPEKMIPINSKSASISGVCCSNHAVLISEEKTPIFINLENMKVTYSQYVIPSKASILVNPDKKELLSLDQETKEIWSITPFGAQLRGKLNSSRDIELIHIDQKGILYFM